MKIIVCENYDEVSSKAAELVLLQLADKPDSIFGLATGSTPIGMYKKLVEAYESGRADFSKVTTFNLDEYYPISPDNRQSYRYFMNEHLFSKINIPLDRTNVPCGEAPDAEKECIEYEERIAKEGGVDLQILGIGQNGHIGFNEPSGALNACTHLAKLTESTIEANARFFDVDEKVPAAALTMGMASIMKSKKIVLLATGENKHTAIKALMNNEITTDIPATLLKVHQDTVIICDKAAFYGNEKSKKLRIGIDLGGTSIKAGIVEQGGKITHKVSAPTRHGGSCLEIVRDMASLTEKLVKEAGYSVKDIGSVGIGCPGIVDSGKGYVTFSGNLGLSNAPVAKEFQKHINVPVSIENDANAAAYGEYKFSGSDCANFVLVTLGTGVGGGIVVDRKITRGFCGAGAEFGHTVLVSDGIPCSCGRKGCYEKYASASALIEQTEEAIKKHPESIMAKEAEITGYTAFDAEKLGDIAAKEVVEKYVSYVSEGLMDIIMFLRPEKIAVGGGISNQGEEFIERIREYIRNNLNSYDVAKTEICAAGLYNDAGIIGAAFAAEI